VLRLLLAAVASLLMITGAFAQDGARANHLIPEGTDIISLTGTFVHTEFAGTLADAAVLTPSYRQSINVGGNAGALLIGIPVGGVSGTIPGVLDETTDLAFGDLFVGGELGLIGSPSLSPMDYAQFKPGFRLSAAAKLFLPTGDYDSSRVFNLGLNRWSLQLALPLSYVLADSMIDPNLTTFELRPVLQIFGDNNDPYQFLNIDKISQAPIWGAEAHITRNFGSTIWASLDAGYEAGGETSYDGVARGDWQEALSLGATLGLVLSPQIALRMRYNEVVYSNLPDTGGRSFEITSAYSF
jgi:hypothetical protein